MKTKKEKVNLMSRFIFKALGVIGLVSLPVMAINNALDSKNRNVLSGPVKEVESPSVPVTLNAPTSPSVASNRKKKIRTVTLNPDRTLVIFEEIGPQTEEVGKRITELSKASKDPIVLLINSPGGSVFSGEKIVSAIEASRADVYTVCVGVCASMAAIIHQYGTKRLATDRAILMFHDAAGMIGGRISEMLSLLNLIRRKLDKTNHYIANRSKISYQELIMLEANNFWIDSEDAMEKGLVDDLVVVQE